MNGFLFPTFGKSNFLLLKAMNTYPNKNAADQAMEKGEYDLALKIYSQALANNPKNPFILSDRGVCFFNNKQFEKALMDLDRAAELDPDNPYRYSSRAFVKGAMKDTHGAIADYQRAITLDPEDAISRNNLGLMQEKVGYWDQAKKNFEVADELAGILKDRNISTDRNLESKSENKQMPLDKEEKSILDEAKSVMTSRSKFSEFLKFVKNGFKLNE